MGLREQIHELVERGSKVLKERQFQITNLGEHSKRPQVILRSRTFENMSTKKSEEATPLSQAELLPAKVFACLFLPHPPEHEPFVSSLFTLQGSLPSSNNNITFGLEKQSPACMKRNRLWSCCGYPGTHIPSLIIKEKGT